MTFEYVGVEEAINRGGLRMVVVGGVPSPWGKPPRASCTSRASNGLLCAWTMTASH